MYVGQGIVPEGWDQRADAWDSGKLDAAIERVRRQVHERVAAMPEHQTFISARNAAIGLAE